MQIVNSNELRQDGADETIIAAYERAVRDASAEFGQESAAWERKLLTIWLGLKTPGDTSVVTAALGRGAAYGRAEGATPAALKDALVARLRAMPQLRP